MRRKFLVLILISTLLISGCWDRREINDLALVVASAIDLEGKQTVFTAQIANPVALIPGQGGGGGTGGGPKAFWTVAGRGVDVWEAIKDITSRIPKIMFFGHTRVLIIGEKACKTGINPFLDAAFRGREGRGNTFLGISRGEAKKILETEMPTFRSSGFALANMFTLVGESQTIMPVTINDFTYTLSTGVTSPVAPMIELVPQSSVSAEDVKAPGGPGKTIRISGLAVFTPDGKLAGFFNREQTLGLMWVLNKVKTRSLTVPCPVEGPKEPITLFIRKSHSKIIVHMNQDGQPEFEIRVKTICDMVEHFGAHTGMLTIKMVKSIERRTNTQIEKEILQTLARSQQMGTDCFGLAEELKRQHYREWQNLKPEWKDIFPMVKVTVNAETSLRNRGLTVESPGGRKEH